MHAHYPQFYAQFCDDLRAEFGEDDQLVADMLEAETDLHDVIGKLLVAEAEADAMNAANKALAVVYTDRASAQAARKEAIRGALWRLMQATGLRKVQHAFGTVSLSRVNPKPKFTGDVLSLPDDLVRIKREPDAAAIKAAVEAGRSVPGVVMTNGGETLVISKRK